MNKLINSDNLTMSSREIAELTGKRHADVLRDIRAMFKELEIGERKFASSYFDSQDKERPVINLNHDLTMTLITGYSIKLRHAVVERLAELESAPAHKLPSTFGEALQLAANQAIEIETQNKLIALQAPAVKFVEDYTQAETGSKGFRQVAKLLKVKENVFRDFLVDHKIMYRLAGEWTAYGNHINLGRFEVTTGESNKHVHNTTKFTAKGINWIAGLWAIELIALG